MIANTDAAELNILALELLLWDSRYSHCNRNRYLSRVLYLKIKKKFFFSFSKLSSNGLVERNALHIEANSLRWLITLWSTPSFRHDTEIGFAPCLDEECIGNPTIRPQRFQYIAASAKKQFDFTFPLYVVISFYKHYLKISEFFKHEPNRMPFFILVKDQYSFV